MNYFALSLLILFSAGLCAMEAPLPKCKISLAQLNMASLDMEKILLAGQGAMEAQYTPRAQAAIGARMEQFINTLDEAGEPTSKPAEKVARPSANGSSATNISKLILLREVNLETFDFDRLHWEGAQLLEKYTPEAQAAILDANELRNAIKASIEVAAKAAPEAANIGMEALNAKPLIEPIELKPQAKLPSLAKAPVAKLISLRQPEIEKVNLGQLIDDPSIVNQYTPRTQDALAWNVERRLALFIAIMELRKQKAHGESYLFAVNGKDQHGYTLLMTAARQGLFNTVKTLVEEYDASISICNTMGETAITLAKAAGHKEIAYYLQNYSKR